MSLPCVAFAPFLVALPKLIFQFTPTAPPSEPGGCDQSAEAEADEESEDAHETRSLASSIMLFAISSQLTSDIAELSRSAMKLASMPDGFKQVS